VLNQKLAYRSIKKMIDDAESISILSHINPDADALGTALGIYAILSEDKCKKVEVVNASTPLPIYLDFLPYYKKIKSHMNYKNSLIISCDCGSIDRLGFDLVGREILNIDHHQSNTEYGTINVVMSKYASSSQVAFELLKKFYYVNKDAATCFYTALLSDTRYFTTQTVNEKVFALAKSLVELGVKADEIACHLTQRRSLSSLRILERALNSLSLVSDAKIAILIITQEDIEATGAIMSDMDGIVDYAKSLVTVEIAILAIELEDEIRISLRSKKIDISEVAHAFGGGGHRVAAGFTLKKAELQESIDTILERINTLNYFNEKNQD